MKPHRKKPLVIAVLGMAVGWTTFAADAPQMSFFVTSKGSGKGGDLGGLQGADATCQRLAQAAGAGNRTWAAYLSTQGQDAVNARDRIGTGPWYNAKGVLIAQNVDALHQPTANINTETAIDEKGQIVPFTKLGADGAPLPRDQQSAEHDMLTGSQADGTAFPAGEDRTCRNWTSSSDGAAMVGHHDRRAMQPPGLSPWGAAHSSRGCSQQDFASTGGTGRFYCFAK